MTTNAASRSTRLSVSDVKSILTRSAGIDPTTLDGNEQVPLSDLGVDSLAALELQAVAETDYQVSLPDELVSLSLADIVATTGTGEPAAAPEPGGHTENSVFIRAPFDLVWDMTNDLPNWPNLFSEYAAIEVLERQGQTVTFRLTMHPDENGISWSWVSSRTGDRSTGRVDSHRVETGPFEYMNIHWTYERAADGTQMTWVQDFHMKPTAPVDDEGMTRHLNKNTKIQMALIAERIERAAHQTTTLARAA